jgi:hypothetical protein
VPLLVTERGIAYGGIVSGMAKPPGRTVDNTHEMSDGRYSWQPRTRGMLTPETG